MAKYRARELEKSLPSGWKSWAVAWDTCSKFKWLKSWHAALLSTRLHSLVERISDATTAICYMSHWDGNITVRSWACFMLLSWLVWTASPRLEFIALLAKDLWEAHKGDVHATWHRFHANSTMQRNCVVAVRTVSVVHSHTGYNWSMDYLEK